MNGDDVVDIDVSARCLTHKKFETIAAVDRVLRELTQVNFMYEFYVGAVLRRNIFHHSVFGHLLLSQILRIQHVVALLQLLSRPIIHRAFNGLLGHNAAR